MHKEQNSEITVSTTVTTANQTKKRFWTKKKLLFADVILMLLLISFDQVIKYFASSILEQQGSIVLL